MVENIIKNDKNSTIEKIIIKYNNGSVKEISKGFIVGAVSGSDEEESLDVSFKFVNINGDDIYNIIYSMSELGFRLGLFD